MDSSLNEEIDEGVILLNQAKVGPFSVVAKCNDPHQIIQVFNKFDQV